MKGSWIAAALAAALFVSGPVYACNGHETRAAETLNELYGNVEGFNVEVTGDHTITVTAPDGTQQTFTGTEQGMVSGASQFLSQHSQVFEDYAG